MKERIRVTFDKKKEFAPIACNNSDSLYKKKNSVFKSIEKYKFYYVKRGLFTNTRSNSENYVKASIHALLLLFEHFNEITLTEKNSEDIKETMLNALSFKNYSQEQMKTNSFNVDLNAYKLMILNDVILPEDFESIVKNEISSDYGENFFSGFLERLLYRCIYDVFSDNQSFEKIKDEKVKNTFEYFKTYNQTSANSHAGGIHQYIWDNIPYFVNELHEDIRKVFNAISKKEYDTIPLTINGKTYSIKIEKEENEVALMKSFASEYNKALEDYKKAVKNNNSESVRNIRESLFNNYFTVGDIYADTKSVGYNFFSTKWLYYSVFHADSGLLQNAYRSFALRDAATAKRNLEVSFTDGIPSEIVEAIESKNVDYVSNILNAYFKESKGGAYLLRQINGDIEADLEKIEIENTDRKEGRSAFSLDDKVSSRFDKQIYTDVEKYLFDAIKNYWERALEKYKELRATGKYDESNFLRSVIIGDYNVSKYLNGAVKLKEHLSNEISKQAGFDLSGEPFIRTRADSKKWVLSTSSKINVRPYFIQALTDFMSYNIVDLYSFFCYYQYDPNFINLSPYLEYPPYESEYYPKNFSSDLSKKDMERKNSFRSEFKKEIDRILGEIETEMNRSASAESFMDKYREAERAYEENEAMVILNSVGVEDFFYVDKKHLPIGKFVDVEFYVYNEDFSGEPYTISVSRRFNKKNESYLYEDNYFSSLELRDLGGVKEIDLVLKSSDETNLEDIIYNSMIGPVGNYEKEKGAGSETLDELYETLRLKDINFRVRFGYSDSYEEKIEDSAILGDRYRSRTDELANIPVKQTPWMYFIIKNITSRTVNNEATYEINGVTLGEDLLSNYSLFGNEKSTHFRGSTTPKGGLSFVSSLLYEASSKKIMILGDDNKALTGKDSEDGGEKVTFENKGVSLKGSFNGLPSIWRTESVSDIDRANKTSISSDLDLENIKNKKGNPSIKDILDEVSKWLPKKMFITAYDKATNKRYAEEYDYGRHSDLLKDKQAKKDVSLVSLSPTYEIIEASAKVGADTEFSKKVIVRYFYKGPTDIGTGTKARRYSFRHKQDTVVKGLTIENEVGLNNIKEYCSLVGGKFKSLYSSMQSTKDSMYPKKNILEQVEMPDSSTYILVPKTNYIIHNIDDVSVEKGGAGDENYKTRNDMLSIANAYSNSLEMWPFSGELEILGDPFYLFDDKLQISKYAIFLDVNRINKSNSNSNTFIKRSYYTGVYLVTGIEHRINSDGDFTTILKILKDITK